VSDPKKRKLLLKRYCEFVYVGTMGSVQASACDHPQVKSLSGMMFSLDEQGNVCDRESRLLERVLQC
jgi:hypothetical protein